ncbi:MAG: hypothetical protein ACKO9F_05055 [Caldilinea sp.]|jgi:hypothetical protein
MSKVQCPSGIPAAEWAATPASVQQLVLTLLQMNEELRERIGKNYTREKYLHTHSIRAIFTKETIPHGYQF